MGTTTESTTPSTTPSTTQHPTLPPEVKSRIDAMSRLEMAQLWRFAKIGDPLLQAEAGDYFKQRFESLGGFNPKISKMIGWDQP
jgi:hypothetical protein